MENKFQYGLVDCTDFEIVAMGLFCTPCLYGMNKAKLDTMDGEVNVNMLSGCCAYVVILMAWQSIGLLLNPFDSAAISQPVIELMANGWGMLGVGMYTGRMRTRLRNKYNIDGNECSDCMMHTIAGPCAHCQEANEIKYRSTMNEMMYEKVPTVQIMEKNHQLHF